MYIILKFWLNAINEIDKCFIGLSYHEQNRIRTMDDKFEKARIL